MTKLPDGPLQASFTRRLTAKAVYAGARIGGGTLPAGTYSLYVYAKGGEGTTVVNAVAFAVSDASLAPKSGLRERSIDDTQRQ